MIIRHVIQALSLRQGEPATLAPEQPVSDAVEMLARRNIGVVMIAIGGGPAGILSERDIVRTLAARGAEALTLPVSDVMTRDPQTCTLEDGAMEVIRRMNDGGFRHMPVLRDGRIAGMVSASDVLRYLASELTVSQREELWSIQIWL